MTVAHVNLQSADLDVDPLGQGWISRLVGVSINGFRWRDQAQLVEDIRSSDVTGMEYHLYPFQCLMHSWSEHPMGI